MLVLHKHLVELIEPPQKPRVLQSKVVVAYRHYCITLQFHYTSRSHSNRLLIKHQFQFDPQVSEHQHASAPKHHQQSYLFHYTSKPAMFKDNKTDKIINLNETPKLQFQR